MAASRETWCCCGGEYIQGRTLWMWVVNFLIYLNEQRGLVQTYLFFYMLRS